MPTNYVAPQWSGLFAFPSSLAKKFVVMKIHVHRRMLWIWHFHLVMIITVSLMFLKYTAGCNVKHIDYSLGEGRDNLMLRTFDRFFSQF